MKKIAFALLLLIFSSRALALTCGQNGKISDRILDCNKKNDSGWKLVLQTDESPKPVHEVWQEPSSSLIFTDKIANFVNYPEAMAICKRYSLPQNSGQKIDWRIPSADELYAADKKSIRTTLKNLDSFFWTSTPLDFFVRSWGLIYSGYNGFFEVGHRSYRFPAVLCVATILP